MKKEAATIQDSSFVQFKGYSYIACSLWERCFHMFKKFQVIPDYLLMSQTWVWLSGVVMC